MPDLDLPNQQIVASCWLAPLNSNVVEGDRLLELLAGEVTVDLSAPATGRLVERLAVEGSIVEPGQALGVIETTGRTDRS